MATRPVEFKGLQRGFRKLPDEHQEVLRKLFNVPETPEHVLHYLARHTHRVAISNHRMSMLSMAR